MSVRLNFRTGFDSQATPPPPSRLLHASLRYRGPSSVSAGPRRVLLHRGSSAQRSHSVPASSTRIEPFLFAATFPQTPSTCPEIHPMRLQIPWKLREGRTLARSSGPVRLHKLHLRPGRARRRRCRGHTPPMGAACASTLACGMPPPAFHRLRVGRTWLRCGRLLHLRHNLVSPFPRLSAALGVAALSASLHSSLALAFSFGQAPLVCGNRRADMPQTLTPMTLISAPLPMTPPPAQPTHRSKTRHGHHRDLVCDEDLDALNGSFVLHLVSKGLKARHRGPASGASVAEPPP